VKFGDAPQRSAADILGMAGTSEPELPVRDDDSPLETESDRDDIPF
jgi:hypothetical protein